MSDVPWFALSPSPLSLSIYVVMILYAAYKIKKFYPDRRLILRLTDGFFLTGLTTLSFDSIWIIFSALRWGSLFPWKDVFQLILCFGRNISGLILCILLVLWLFHGGVVKVRRSTILIYAINVIYLAIWFSFSISPAGTDWTYAIRHNAPFQVILTSFFLSHIIGRFPVALFYYSMFCRYEEKTK